MNKTTFLPYKSRRRHLLIKSRFRFKYTGGPFTVLLISVTGLELIETFPFARPRPIAGVLRSDGSIFSEGETLMFLIRLKQDHIELHLSPFLYGFAGSKT